MSVSPYNGQISWYRAIRRFQCTIQFIQYVRLPQTRDDESLMETGSARTNRFRTIDKRPWQQYYYNTYNVIYICIESICTRNYTAIGVAVRSGWQPDFLPLLLRVRLLFIFLLIFYLLHLIFSRIDNNNIVTCIVYWSCAHNVSQWFTCIYKSCAPDELSAGDVQNLFTRC